MPMTIDELFYQATQLPLFEQDELVQRLLTLRRKQRMRSLLPPGVPGSVWLEHWPQVQINPTVADEFVRIIEEECEQIDGNDWK